MLYRYKVRLMKSARGNALWRSWRARRGDDVGSGDRLIDHIRDYAPGKSWVDVGCMWGVDGAHAFLAEEAGARMVKGVDVFGPTPEFERIKVERGSGVDFILGDATDPHIIERVGVADVVFCAGVLYHHPSPYDLLAALRRMCGETLILRTSAIPEVDGLPNAAVYWPNLPPSERRQWSIPWLGKQVGITDGFEAGEGYGNWFWGLSPSCLQALLETAGFRVVRRFPEAFVQTVVCEVCEVPFAHRMPSEPEARLMGREVSLDGGTR
jgi:SAM-dependent methyltransferase